MGRRPKVEDAVSLERIQSLLCAEPRSEGYDLDRWSLAAIADAIRRSLGVVYHRRHLTRLMRRLGWVVPPTGKSAHFSFRELAGCDPEGNLFFLRAHPRAPSTRP